MKINAGKTCECGHEKRDHALPLLGTQCYGPCKVCLCDRYLKPEPRPVAVAVKAGSHA